MCRGLGAKIHFFKFFFNCFSNNDLVLSILSKTPQFSHQMRKFVLLRGASFFETQTAYGNNYRISTNFKSPRGERSKINQFESFMQNKPNLPDAQMNVSSVLTKDYENIANWNLVKTKPIQTQSNPISNRIPILLCG